MRLTSKRIATVGFALMGVYPPAFADDACSKTAIHTYADVTVSDGKTYSVEGFYRSKDRVLTKFIRASGDSFHAVEGPYTWVQSGDAQEIAGKEQETFQRDFALGHQFHALMLYFHDIMHDIEPVTGIEFAGQTVSALKGTRDTGGTAYLIDGNDPNRPAGLRFDVGDLKIDTIASNWRDIDGKPVPFTLLIDDKSRTFEYRYKLVDMKDKPLLWFYENLPAPDIDKVQILRLHTQTLMAHCLGDAQMFAGLAALSPVIASGGQLFDTNPEQMQSIFTGTFERRKYSNYIDTKYPDIHVSQSGDLGWAAIQVNAKGTTNATGEQFDEHWAWFMLAKKIDGAWRMAGNAANIKP